MLLDRVHQYPHTAAILALVLLSISFQAQSADPSLEELSSTTIADPLPLGTILDSQGRPIAIPAEPQSALEYSAAEAFIAEPQKPQATRTKPATKPAKTKKLSRKQQLASRDKVANDPNCRWLDTRMDQLEAQIKGKQDNKMQYVSEEIKARQKEWQCLKCGAEGPKQGDRTDCQYRR